jgi:hypothetical protein
MYIVYKTYMDATNTHRNGVDNMDTIPTNCIDITNMTDAELDALLNGDTDPVNDFAAQLLALDPGYHFVDRIPVCVSTIPIIAGPPREPQRMYSVLGKEYASPVDAAAWALS